MRRRKFIAGVGALGAGAAITLGTGAVTTATMGDRAVTVTVDPDDESTIALVPGDDPDVTIDNGGELDLDLTGSGGEGDNINSTYTWGDPSDPAGDHAFKVVNNDEESKMLKMNYYFSNTGWIQSNNGVGNGQSFIKFWLVDEGPSASGSSARTYPDQRGSYNRDHSLGMPTGSGFGSNSGSYRFNPGEEYYVVVQVNTEGPYASTADDLSGSASFEVGDSTSGDSWDPRNPPN